jgi:catechol 2,3-dioxygenase-like lactoylglutathione lyase family enzyme
MDQTTITDIRTVGIPVSNQDKALTFFVDTLRFEKRLDARVSDSFRWVTAPRRARPPPWRLLPTLPPAPTLASASWSPMLRSTMRPCATGESRWETCCAGREPPMFEFKDPDGNRFAIVEETP